ncbi:MAG: vWA domain-containing protein [Nitriliruptoraceae bacterium]
MSAGQALVDRVLALVVALRRAGLPAAQTGAIDAVRVLKAIDLADRDQVREALAAVVVSAPSQRSTFDELFELYLPAHPSGSAGAADEPDADASDSVEELTGSTEEEVLDALRSGDRAAIARAARRAVEQHGRVEGRDGRVTYFQYRVLRALDLPGLVAALLEADEEEVEALSPLQERLLRERFEARVRQLRREIDVAIRQHAVEDRGLEQVAARVVRPPIEERDLFALTREERAELQTQLRPLARKLATRVAAKRRPGRDGRLDVRRTVRRSLLTGGVPVDPVFRPRRPHKPELVLLCDVSGSVASFSRFTLQLVHALQERFTTVRSFAFIDELDEVTRWFRQGDAEEAARRMLVEAELVHLDGHSDYGRALSRFHLTHLEAVTARGTVLVLGDARNNHRQANAWVLEEVRRRARQVYWLNPEPRRFWDSGDSIASTYARHVDAMVEVRNLAQLATFVEELG